MAVIFVLAFFLLILVWVFTLIGLINPKKFQSHWKRKVLTRKDIALGGFISTVVLFIVIGVTAPDPVEQSASTPVDVQQFSDHQVKIDEQEKAVETSPEPTKTVKVESNIGMTPEQFRQGFNKRLSDLDIDSIRPLAEFTVKEGNVHDIFQVPFSDEINMTGTVNKDGMLREITFIVVPDANHAQKTMIDSLLVIGTASNTISGDQNKNEVGKVITSLINKALEGIDNKNNSHNKTVEDIKYYALASKYTGLWFGISPAKEG